MPCSWRFFFFVLTRTKKRKKKEIWDQNHFDHMIYCMHAACNRNNMLLSKMFGLWLIYFFIPQLPWIIQTTHCSPNAQKRPNSCKYPSLNVTFELHISLWQIQFCTITACQRPHVTHKPATGSNLFLIWFKLLAPWRVVKINFIY